MKRTVQVEQNYTIASGLLWQLVRDFYDDWHPAMHWCKEEANNIRHFKADDGEYKEQLLEHSDSQQYYRYTMIQGIKLESYVATVQVEKLTANTAKLIWSADLDASEETVDAIAKGTKAIFEMGFKKLEQIIKKKKINTLFLPSPSKGNPNLALDTAGQGELCLFLHGIGGGRDNWAGQVVELSDSGQMVALDIRGYGDSEQGEALSVKSVNNDILAIMKHFQKEKIHLIGLSFGSWLAASFADIHPEKVASLTLTAGSTGMTEAPQEERDAFTKARLEPIRSGVTPADIAETVINFISGPFGTDETKVLMVQSMASVKREAYLDALTCFLNPPAKIAFEKFAFPTLFMTGEYDKLAPPEEMKAVSKRVPNASFKKVAKAGHLVNLDCPKVFNDTLAEFLREAMV